MEINTTDGTYMYMYIVHTYMHDCVICTCTLHMYTIHVLRSVHSSSVHRATIHCTCNTCTCTLSSEPARASLFLFSMSVSVDGVVSVVLGDAVRVQGSGRSVLLY